jgi:cytochrome c biogenesis factor
MNVNEFWIELHPFFKVFIIIALITIILGILSPLFEKYFNFKKIEVGY